MNRPMVYSVTISGIDQRKRKKIQARIKVKLPEEMEFIFNWFVRSHQDGCLDETSQPTSKVDIPEFELATATMRGNRQMFPVPKTHPRQERISPAE